MSNIAWAANGRSGVAPNAVSITALATVEYSTEGGVHARLLPEVLGPYLSPDIGRKRPYKIGDPSDVETAQRMYPFITSHRAKTEWESRGLAYCLGPL